MSELIAKLAELERVGGYLEKAFIQSVINKTVEDLDKLAQENCSKEVQQQHRGATAAAGGSEIE